MYVVMLFLICSATNILKKNIYCFQETRCNEEEFPRTALRGMSEGVWWAYVTMTTVG